jgi:hypothetical protein
MCQKVYVQIKIQRDSDGVGKIIMPRQILVLNKKSQFYSKLINF